MTRRKSNSKAVKWLSDETYDSTCLSSIFRYYTKFQFKNIIGEVGDYVLISNADLPEPDTEDGCDTAQIITLYEDPSNENNPFRAKVKWFSRCKDIPDEYFKNSEPIDFLDKEVIEDHRPFGTDVSIETFLRKCKVTMTFTKHFVENIKEPFSYICRYRLMVPNKKKAYLEPVLEEERNALLLLSTPYKGTTKNRNSSTPSTLIKRMGRVSISEQKNWSVSKNNGTKILLKRAFQNEKTEIESSKILTPKSENTFLNISECIVKLDDICINQSMELREYSDDELPTLIITQHVPTTPKRKQSVLKINIETPKKRISFDDENSYITRTGRKIKNSVMYKEHDLSPVKNVSRKSVRKITESDDDFKPSPKTPKMPRTPRMPRTPKTPSTPKTPKIVVPPKSSVKKRILTSQITPSLRARVHSVDDSYDILKESKTLPGREKQLDNILSFLKEKLFSGISGCMYISGAPGTGKTATVCLALENLKKQSDLPDFQLVEVNGMRITEPRQIYVQIYKQLTGKTVVWEQACSLLEKRFTNPGPRRIHTVMLVDELDALCTRRQDVLSNILNWALHETALLTVLTVANTMDLPERVLANSVSSRLGLTRLTFEPYTVAQLQRIVSAKLASVGLTRDAVELIARKVAAVSGDARRALALCTRALELSGPNGAGLKEVQQALGEAYTSVTVRAIRSCSAAERLMLRAIAAEIERTGTEETTLSRALSTAEAIVALDGRPYKCATQIRAPTPSQALAVCTRLASMRLILMEPKPSEPRLLLGVSLDDVHYATRQINVNV